MKCATAALFCFLFYPASLPAQSQKTLLLGDASFITKLDQIGFIDGLYKKR